MAVPPLYRTPHLSRLLGPGEEIVYTAKLHPFYGIGWLLAAVLFIALGYWVWPYLAVLAMPFLIVYMLPFKNHEVAVTNCRLLIRQGRFSVHTYALDSDHLDHYRLHENTIGEIFHFGTLILSVRQHREIKMITLACCWHPMTLLEALTTLNPLFRTKVGSTR